MQCSRPLGLVLMTTLSLVYSMPSETTTTRSTSPIGDTIKKLTNQLMEVNSTSLDMIYDVRTPPKVKQQQQIKMKLKEELENSHAGIAIPVDEDSIEMEETTKKLNFYKIERPTTNSGLSTWILLSGQTSMTTRPPPTRKPVIKPNSEDTQRQNVTVVVNDRPKGAINPIFKKRPTTTVKPKTTTTPTSTTAKVSKETTKLSKVKASVLNTAVSKKNMTTPASGTTKKSVSTTPPTSTRPTVTITNLITRNNVTRQNTTLSTTDSGALPVEAKEGEVELSSTTANKKKKTSGKRKKNKTRRRKPSDKDTNSTSVSKPSKTHKQNPLGTQFYNYLSREIMPTVGVGLVGLMVTAGLASYFLYPFGALRRTYDVDRKDKEGSYYYNDEYSGGMLEEEAIGKVIAGMPSNSLYANSYKPPSSRNTFPSAKYRLTDRRAQIPPQPYGMLGTVEDVPLTPKQQEQNADYDNPPNFQSNPYEPITYTNDLGSRYASPSDKQFVVGNIPKEIATEVTPASVPEHGPRNFNSEEIHAEEPTFVVNNTPKEVIENTKPDEKPSYGPRSLRIRRKRSEMPNDLDNEISSSLDGDREEVSTIGDITTEKDITTTDPPLSSTTSNSQTTENITTTIGLPDKVSSFIDLMKELIHFKARMGLQVIQNVTQSISKYISRVQARLDQHYREYSKSKN